MIINPLTIIECKLPTKHGKITKKEVPNMKKPEYIGYAACAAVASQIAAPVLFWCTTTSAISTACSWAAVAA